MGGLRWGWSDCWGEGRNTQYRTRKGQFSGEEDRATETTQLFCYVGLGSAHGVCWLLLGADRVAKFGRGGMLAAEGDAAGR